MAYEVTSRTDAHGRHVNDRRDFGRPWLWQEATGVGSLKSHWRAGNTLHNVKVFPPSPGRDFRSVTVDILEIAQIPVGGDDNYLAFATAEAFARQCYSLLKVLSNHGLELA